MMTFLIGMPGAGKSYWGQQAATHYNLPFTDLDTFITEQEGMPIPQIFDLFGEGGFREREHKYLTKAIETVGEGSIIACGGGTPCFYDNMELMKATGTVIYLKADPDYLYQNLLQSVEARPLLTPNLPVLTRVTELLGLRSHYYEQAHHILQAKDISLATFEKIIQHV